MHTSRNLNMDTLLGGGRQGVEACSVARGQEWGCHRGILFYIVAAVRMASTQASPVLPGGSWYSCEAKHQENSYTGNMTLIVDFDLIKFILPLFHLEKEKMRNRFVLYSSESTFGFPKFANIKIKENI